VHRLAFLAVHGLPRSRVHDDAAKKNRYMLVVGLGPIVPIGPHKVIGPSGLMRQN
jgi:hypothetical protein